MQICFMCDLHLPSDRLVLQYDMLQWACADVAQKKPDCIVFVGDATCDGDEGAYDFFINKIRELNLPFFYIPGNSDLRDPKTCESIKVKSSPTVNAFGGLRFYAVNDCERTVCDAALEALGGADENSVVFMHHPIERLTCESSEKMQAWREAHPEAMLFFGHQHESYQDKNGISLQAMDPDKAIGECPCITYFDTDSKAMTKSYYDAPVPRDMYDYFGISCYRLIEQIRYATKKQLKCLELRPSCADFEDRALLKEAIQAWRNAGGENLSVHFPEIGWADGHVLVHEQTDALVALVQYIGADRITQHVPRVSVQSAKENPQVLESICDCLCEKFNAVAHDIVIGVENMHMTAKDAADDTRRFGYLPEECLLFMQMLGEKCRHKVGINFDIGHARNNAPYSQTYQISTWLEMVGKHIVGYHIHQVTKENGALKNHMPITGVYTYLISYASIFKHWATGKINKAPFVFEMPGEDSYEITLRTFDGHRA